MDQHGRFLQSYKSPRMRIAAGEGGTGQIRVSYNYEFLSSTKVGHCYNAGENQDPCSKRNAAACPFTCKEEDVLTTEKINLVKKVNEWLEPYIEGVFQVNSETSPFSVDPSKQSFDMAGIQTSFPDTDLVVYMTMQTNPTASVSGFAYCTQRNPVSGRCTVGVFNFVPAAINVKDFESPDVKQLIRSTALHETLHIIGCCDPTGVNDNMPFRYDSQNTANANDYGKPRPFSEVAFVKTGGDPGFPNRPVCACLRVRVRYIYASLSSVSYDFSKAVAARDDNVHPLFVCLACT